MSSTEENPEWRLYYWPLCGRGEFVRLIFEDAGVEFEECNDVEKIKSLGFGGGGDGPNVQGSKGWPCFAIPMLQNLHTGFTISQTPVVCKYLGNKLGYGPSSEEDAIRADQINATIHDFIGEGRLAFHGKNFYLSYYDQEEETKPYIEYFIANRLPRFLTHFERLLEFNEGAFLIGKKITFVDLALLHVLRAAESQFPQVWKAQIESHPRLKDFKTQMEQRERLHVYFQSSRCRPFEGNSMM